MPWEIEYTDEFGDWWQSLSEDEQVAIAARVALLEQHGPNLRRPAVGAIKDSRHDPQMKELRISVSGEQLRILFIFDPRAWQSCSSAATRPASGKPGTPAPCRRPTRCTTPC